MKNRLWILGPLMILCLAMSDGVTFRDLARADEEEPASKAGHHVQWQGWDFTWSIRPREGLSLPA